MRNPFRVWEPGDEQMSHRKAAALSVVLALLGAIGLSLCGPSASDCKMDCDGPATTPATALG